METFWMSLVVAGLWMTGWLVLVPGVSAGPVAIEDVAVQPKGAWLLEAGFDWETGRDLGNIEGIRNLEYDNLRLHPLRATYGFMRNLEVGMGLGYSSNSADQTQPDEGGFEGVTLHGKYRWNQTWATSVRLSFLGNDEIVPYSADGFNLGVNVPARMSVGPGAAFGELGFTFQSGDFILTDPSSGNEVEFDRDFYFNYGVGYVYDVNRWWDVSAEIWGHTATVEDAEDSLELVLGSPIKWNRQTTLVPDLTFGVSDGSPDFAFGFNYQYAFGGPTGPRKPLYSEGGPTGEPEQQQQPLILPGEQEQPQQGRNPRRARQLAEEATRAYNNGNRQLALQKFRQATEADPQNADVHFNLGTLYFEQGNFEQARNQYRRVVEINPRDATAHYYLGLTYERLGNAQQARNQYQRVLDIDSGHQKAQRRLQNL